MGYYFRNIKDMLKLRIFGSYLPFPIFRKTKIISRANEGVNLKID